MIVNIHRLPIKHANNCIKRGISRLDEKKLRKERRRQERLENQRKKILKKENETINASYFDKNIKPGDRKDVSLGIPSKYYSTFVESSWYDWWEKQGFFSPNIKVKS